MRIKSALLTDEQVYELVDYAAWLRTGHTRQDQAEPEGGPEDGPAAGSAVAS